MLKNALKNFFVNLKYVFTPLGVMFLGALSGLAVLISSVTTAVSELSSGVTALLNSTELDGSALLNEIVATFLALDWTNLGEVANTITNPDWLTSVFGSGVRALIVYYDAHVAEITACVNTAVTDVIGGVVCFFALSIVGFAVGYLITALFIRRETVSSSLPKYILSVLLGTALATLALFAFLALSNVEALGAGWAFVIVTVVGVVVTLAEAYLLHGLRKVKFTRAFNPKNLVGLLLSELLILLATVALTAIVALAFGAVCGVFVGLSLLTVAAIVVGGNAESYVSRLAEQPTEILPAEEPTERSENE